MPSSALFQHLLVSEVYYSYFVHVVRFMGDCTETYTVGQLISFESVALVTINMCGRDNMSLAAYSSIPRSLRINSGKPNQTCEGLLTLLVVQQTEA